LIIIYYQIDNYVDIECFCVTIYVYPLILKCKPLNRILLITDCQTVGGLPAGEYESGGMTLVVDDKIARLKDGTIAGSVISQNIALKNFYLNSNITLPQAVKMASLNQAELLGIGNITGSISVGKKADFAILNKEFDAEMTIVEGKVKFEKGKYS
jgi:N-acetylglucosamine-6-phosphate deacetylase